MMWLISLLVGFNFFLYNLLKSKQKENKSKVHQKIVLQSIVFALNTRIANQNFGKGTIHAMKKLSHQIDNYILINGCSNTGISEYLDELNICLSIFQNEKSSDQEINNGCNNLLLKGENIFI